MTSQSASENNRKEQHRVEGPKKHIIAFIFSVLLTLIAFVTVASGEINTDFVYIILVGSAILQVFIQLAFWMHMKDRGHTFAIIGILGGVFVVLLCVVMALAWVWW